MTVFGTLFGMLLVAQPFTDRDFDRAREDLVYSDELVFSDYRLTNEIVDDSELLAFLRRIVAELDPEVSEKIEVAVVKSTAPNAWIGARGRLFVSTGMLALLENEDQLATVLAHEIAHFKLDHAVTAYLDHKNRLEQVNRRIWNSSLRNALLATAKYSREDELAADLHSFNMILSSAYDVREAVRAIYRLAETSSAAEAEISKLGLSIDAIELEMALRTHPHIVDRLDAAKHFADAHKASEVMPRSEKYRALTDSIFRSQVERARVLRDGSFLRVLLTGVDAKSRLAVDYFFYMVELYRLDGSDSEKAKIDKILDAVQVQFPNQPKILLARARSAFNSKRTGDARSQYRRYLELVPDLKPNSMDVFFGGEVPVAFDPMEEACESVSDHRWSHYRSIRVSLPCEWAFAGDAEFRNSVSRNGTNMDEIWAYHSSYVAAFGQIGETVDEKSDLLDLIEIYRAKLLRVYDESYYEIGGSGVLSVAEVEWGWFDYSWRDEWGVRKVRRQFLRKDGDGLTLVAFVAPERRYFNRYLPEAIRVVQSLRTDF